MEAKPHVQGLLPPASSGHIDPHFMQGNSPKNYTGSKKGKGIGKPSGRIAEL